MVKAYCRTTVFIEYPLQELSNIFGFEDKIDVIEFCKSLGWNPNKHNSIIFNRDSFQTSNFEDFSKSMKYPISRSMKFKHPLEYYITKGVSLEKYYEDHIPYDSFDSNGHLIQGSNNKMLQEKRKQYPKKSVNLTNQEILERVQTAVKE